MPKAKITMNTVVNKLVRYGSHIIFVAALLILCYISFVDDFNLSTDIQRVSLITIIGSFLNYMVWDSQYQGQYNKELDNDARNEKYSIHRRYYNARKTWKYDDLRAAIKTYNKGFVQSWINDIEDITGYTYDELMTLPMNKMNNKHLVKKLRKHKYPKSGISTPRDMLYVLAVGKSDSMKIDTRAAEHHLMGGRIRKIAMSILSMLLTATIVVQFIDGNLATAIFTLIMNIGILVFSAFFGATSGIKGAQMKLNVAEQVSELLEQWKDQKPSEEPYVEKKEETKEEVKPIEEVKPVEEKKEIPKIVPPTQDKKVKTEVIIN